MTELIQVCWSLENPQTLAREVKALAKAQIFFKKAALTLITLDEEKTLVHEGQKIEVVPIWKWLLRV